MGLGGAKSYMQNKETGQKTRINYEDGAVRRALAVAGEKRRCKRRRREP